MYIIKKFNDYYDSAIGASGVDRTCVYNREPQTIGTKLAMPYQMGWRTTRFIKDFRHGQVPNFKCFVLGFCGKLYKGMIVEWPSGKCCDRRNRMYSEQELYFGSELCLEKYDEFQGSSFYRKDFERFFNEFSFPEDLFIKHHVPTFVVFIENGTTKIQLNPCLKDWEFYKFMDSFTAFQEIQMFLSGVIGNTEVDTVVTDDKSKLIARGFDPKTSFRKEKQKK